MEKEIKAMRNYKEKLPEKCVDVEIKLSVNGRPWSYIQWKKLTPAKFLKLADMIEDIEF